MKTNFLMVNYNDYENVRKIISMISEYKVLDKIIIVDNKSTDDSLKKIRQIKNPKIIVLESDHNGGYGYGINIGAKYISRTSPNSYIIVSNTDIIIDNENNIQNLIETFQQDTAIVAPIIKEHTGYNCGWKIPSPWQDIILSIPIIYKSYQKKMIYEIEQLKSNITEVEAVSGSFFIIKSSILESIDYFDENIFLYYEENIVSKKIQKIEKKILINGHVEVFHNHSVTINKVHNNVQKYKNLKKSQYYFQTNYNHAGIVSRMTMKILFFVIGLGMYVRDWKIKKTCEWILLYSLFSIFTGNFA